MTTAPGGSSSGQIAHPPGIGITRNTASPDRRPARRERPNRPDRRNSDKDSSRSFKETSFTVAANIQNGCDKPAIISDAAATARAVHSPVKKPNVT